MSEANDIEIFATGNLYIKISNANWSFRKFSVVGQFFAFYDQNDVQRGQFDLKGSRVKCLSPVEVKNLKAKFVIGLYGSSGTPWLVCALSEADRDIWMDVLNHQIEEFKDDNRAFLSGGEVVRGVALVRKGGRFGTSKFRLLLTNHPRVLLIDSEKMVIKEELRWESDSLPRFVLVRFCNYHFHCICKKKLLLHIIIHFFSPLQGEDSNFNIVQGERELKLKMEPGGRGIDAWQKMFLNIAKLRSFRLRFSREPVVIGMSGKLPEDLERLDWIELSSRVSLTSIPSEWQALGDPGKLAPVMLYDSSDIGSGIDAIEHVSVGRRAQSTDVSSLQASFLAAKESPKSAKFSIDDLPSDKVHYIFISDILFLMLNNAMLSP